MKNSLVLKIAIAYLVLMMVNLIFFSVIIVENQTDLITTNFKHQADSLAKSTLSSLRDLRIERSRDASAYAALDESLKVYDLNWYQVFDEDGTIWHDQRQTKADSQEESKVSKRTLQKLQQLSSTASLFQARYLVELQKEDFSIELLLPLGKSAAANVFLFASLNLKSMQDRINLVYYQVAGALVWGIIFHVLFGIFLLRLIFRRVSLLVDASIKMGKGNLGARVEWKMEENKKDELDVLGTSFNSMAASVQEKVDTISEQITTITKLNRQIQQELKIGKEVQQLLISAPEDVITDFKPQVYYRPLREVSGDMFHYFRLPDGGKGVFFADASGHGVPAALVTAISFLSLEDVLRRDVPKEDLMNALNENIVQRMQQSFYLTAVFMLFDGQGQVWLTNAGHNTFFILPSQGERINIESDGLPLGVLPGSEYPLHTRKISSGDRVFVYSDGLVETTNAQGEEFGMERLQNILDKNKPQALGEMAGEVQRDFDEFACNFNDDVTFLALEVP